MRQPARTSPMDTPRGFEGVCSTHGVTCGICFWIHKFPSVHRKRGRNAHQEARAAGFRHHPASGWHCSRCEPPPLTAKQKAAERALEERNQEKLELAQAKEERRRTRAINRRVRKAKPQSQTPTPRWSTDPVRVDDIKDFIGKPDSR